MARIRIIALILALLVPATILAASPSVASVVGVRTKFFGAGVVDQATGAVDPNKVVLSWFGVTNFAAAIGGHVVLLDAWVPRGEYSGYIPTTPSELAALRPEYVILGHGHFDHAADAAQIAVASGATLVGTPEHCDQARRQATPAMIECIAAVPRGSLPGVTAQLSFLEGVGITAVKHVHSAGRAHDASDPHAPAAPPPNADAIIEHPPSAQDAVGLASHLGDGEHGTVLYQFRVGDFSMVWHDSSGPLKEDAPGVFDVLRSLRPTDVQVAAIMGFNQITNGLRDPRMYAEALAPKVFIPSHHDNWAPGVSTRGDGYRPYIEQELAKIPAGVRPILQFIADPQDYLNPIVFDVTSAVWA